MAPFNSLSGSLLSNVSGPISVSLINSFDGSDICLIIIPNNWIFSSANKTAIWAGKIKDHAMSNFETPIDDIFRANGAKREYPSRPEPELPEDEDDRVGFKVSEVAYVSKTRFDEKLAVEKIQLFGIMIGQISEPSKELIKETEIGPETFDNKDPLKLLKGAIQTHMSDSRLGAK